MLKSIHQNFNGIKDILPILQSNISKALGGKETLSEQLIEMIKDTPFVLQDLTRYHNLRGNAY